MNVVALGDHLRADQQVHLAGVHGVQHALEISMAAHRIAVEASDAGLRELAVRLLQLLRTGSENCT